jgi:hypothetical protein
MKDKILDSAAENAIYQKRIKNTLDGLKDFQTKTVDYVFEQLYVKHKTKMLVADEVGLGKTIVAKGLIAKAFNEYLKRGGQTQENPTFDVVYICSNLALASQNISKLNFLKESKYVDRTITRLTYLAYKPKDHPPVFQIHTLTPGTSFDEKSHQGEIDERAIIFCLIAENSSFFNHWTGLKWLLKSRVNNETWNSRIKEFFSNRKNLIRNDLFKKYMHELSNFNVNSTNMPKLTDFLDTKKDITLRQALLEVCKTIKPQNHHKYNFQSEIIRILRRLLSKLCLEYLGADLFILDEFQRYNNLIKVDEEPQSPAIEVARTVFNIKGAKVLMLSATPFKPYTNDFDALSGEVHYKEFKSVLQFLMDNKDDKFWNEYEADRKSLFGYLRHPETLEENKDKTLFLKNKLETLYRSCFVRTEKLLASRDRDALIKHADKDKPITIQPEDINDFVALDQITVLLNKEHKASLPVPLEYVKSCPYALSFLDNYQHKEKIRTIVLTNDKLKKMLKDTKHGWINLKDINEYKPLIPAKGKTLPNAKLRMLLDETVKNDGWKYLWIPPSLPYYELDGAYKGSWGYSKTLLFSSWKMVPRMVSSLVSYEAERLSVGNPKSISVREKTENPAYKAYYFQKRRSPRPQFTFKLLKGEKDPQQMNNFILLYPCLFLTKLYDPAKNITEKKGIKQIKKDLKNELVNHFNHLNLNKYATGDGDWRKWYWLAPLLLDKSTEHNHTIAEWFRKGLPPSELSIDSENEQPDRDESNGKKMHFEHAKAAFLSNTGYNVKKLTQSQLETICEHLVELTLGSPAICFLRSLLRYNDLSGDDLELSEPMDASFNVASAFFTMLNKPESIAIVRLHTNDGDYWERCLKYMIDGNIQAMLDEFSYLLIQGENIRDAAKLSDFISDILSTRTTSAVADDYQSFIDNIFKVKKKPNAMRSHYAVDFGIQKINTAKGAGRQINIRQAFNSPFRPFVLASTSIGQEGLDFHFYCKKIFHWNLPTNPIEFEQREGRIHRYQGLVIRLNLADKYRSEISFRDDSYEVWKEVFEYAEKEKAEAKYPCDIVPYWHTETNNDIKIERFVPLYPFSKDREKFDNLIKVLTFYRLTFGQPRQEELIESLNEFGYGLEDIENLEKLMINLSPITFY